MTRLTLILMLSLAGAAHAGPELTRAYILSIVKDAKPDVEECGRSLKSETLKTRFVIDASGDVRDVKIDGKHAKDAVGACVKQKLMAMRFGPSLKSMPVSIPWKLGENGPTPPPSDDDKVAAGGKKLDKKEVGDLMKVLQSNMGSCGTGVVDTHFTITADGLVRQVKLEGDHSEDQTGKCVAGKLTRARFPATGAVTSVTHSFRLE